MHRPVGTGTVTAETPRALRCEALEGAPCSCVSQGRLLVEVPSKPSAEPEDAGESVWPRGGETRAGGRGNAPCKNLVVRKGTGGSHSVVWKETDFEQRGTGLEG